MADKIIRVVTDVHLDLCNSFETQDALNEFLDNWTASIPNARLARIAQMVSDAHESLMGELPPEVIEFLVANTSVKAEDGKSYSLESLSNMSSTELFKLGIVHDESKTPLDYNLEDE